MNFLFDVSVKCCNFVLNEISLLSCVSESFPKRLTDFRQVYVL